MKKIKVLPIALAALSMLLLGGCTDFLDVKPKGKDVAQRIEHYDGLFNTPAAAGFTYETRTETGAVVDNAIHWIYMTDELITDQAIAGNMTVREKNAFQWKADIFEQDNVVIEYAGLYQQIYTYNMIVNGVMDASDGTQEQKHRILAEARVARAYNYMMLAQFFGKPYNAGTAATDLCVPLTLEASISGTTSYTRATVQEIYDFILTELQEAVPDLSEYTLHRQRIYRLAGYAILGRAYMLVYDYEKAAAAFAQAEALMAKSNVLLALFDYKNQLPVWKANMMWAYGMGYPTNFESINTEVIYNRNVSTGLGGGLLNSPKVLVKPEYMLLLTADDLRRELYNSTGYSNYRRDYRTAHNEGVDLPNFYLMYAECLARTGNENKARELVTLLRERRFKTTALAAIPGNVVTQNDLIRFIVEERLREYMSTGHRWFDMRRLWNDPLFQDLKANYTHVDGANTYTLTEDRLTYRIPPSVMIHNPGWENNK